MLDRQKTILTSAFDVFTRYGVKRATMNDIASEAGIARQTLYNTFANKDAILRALIQDHKDQTVAIIEECTQNNTEFSDSLDALFENVACKPYMLLKTTPHGNEILEGITNSAQEELTNGYKAIAKATTAMIQKHLPDNSTFAASDLAELIVYSALSIKYKAESKTQLDNLLSTLKTLVLNSVEETTK